MQNIHIHAYDNLPYANSPAKAEQALWPYNLIIIV